ncbi:hypothetical protein L3Q82_002083 [Scortum barcoo]|uniref:Uncharacterized protein n=1 Tax=Scortum barcoo TaxID=214431 RepID=A0ACB8W1Y3_9TELE|nr:hypothetical protein L3Q82_002083 [Scortum barcoo]
MLMVTDEEGETQDGEESLGGTPSSSAQEACIVDVKTITTSGSPRSDCALNLRADEGAATTAQKPSSPKIDLTIQPQEDRGGMPEVKGLNLTDILPTLPQENGEKMEIEIPLSVFHNWLRLCGSSAAMLGAKQLPAHPAPEDLSGSGTRSRADVLPANLTFHMSPQYPIPNFTSVPKSQYQSSGAEDLRLRRSNLPSKTMGTAGNHNHSRQNPFTGHKPLPSGGILKNAASRDAYLFDQDYINKTYCSTSPNCWDAYDKEAPPIQFKMDSNPLAVQQASKSFNEDTVQGGKEKSETSPSALLMLNSSSASLLQLTTEEVMKLKKIISSSS